MVERTLHNIRNGLAEVFTNVEFEETDEALVIRMKKTSKTSGIQTTLKAKPTIS